jgi:chemosensory pili system protein ChpA (sensor histidine kinase/response regulator)
MIASTRRSAYPDATTVIAIASEMAVAVKEIAESFVGFAEKPSEKPISESLRRVCDTARLISLRALAILLEEMTELARRIEEGEVKVGQSEIDAIRDAISSVHRYIGNASAGKIGSGLLMYAAYSEVMRCMPGRSALGRGEFFLPVVPVYGPNSPTYAEGKFIAEIARYQDEFRQSRLRYAERRDLETLNSMRTTLVTMEAKSPPSCFRVFFSLAISFLDVAMRAGGKIPKEDEPLLLKIDHELAGIVKGELSVDESSVSWMLYIIAQAPQFSARVRTFHEAYDLPRMIEDDLGGVVSEQSISAARTALDGCQQAWESATAGSGDIAVARTSSLALASVCNTLGDYALKTMSVAMGALADAASSGSVKVTQELAVFGASILISIGERLERITHDPKGGRAAADFHKDRVKQVLAGRSPGDLPSVSQAYGAHVQGILDEVLQDLQSAEQIIEQCLRDGASVKKVDEASKLFTLIQHALAFVNMEDGSNYAGFVASEVDRVLRMLVDVDQKSIDAALAGDDKQRVAESVMMLHRYLTLVHVDPKQAQATLEKGMEIFSKKDSVVDAVVVQESEGPLDICVDDELGPIFFDEAKTVILDNVLPGIERLRTNPTDEATLLEVRRGFHTLKGSSRMVELNNLGFVGQYAEYVLNVCRDNRGIRPSPEMLDWLEDAAKVFATAIESLEMGQPARVDSEPFRLVYETFSTTMTFPSAAPSMAEMQPAPVGATQSGLRIEPVVLDIPESGVPVRISETLTKLVKGGAPDTGLIVVPPAAGSQSDPITQPLPEVILDSIALPSGLEGDEVSDSSATIHSSEILSSSKGISNAVHIPETEPVIHPVEMSGAAESGAIDLSGITDPDLADLVSKPVDIEVVPIEAELDEQARRAEAALQSELAALAEPVNEVIEVAKVIEIAGDQDVPVVSDVVTMADEIPVIANDQVPGEAMLGGVIGLEATTSVDPEPVMMDDASIAGQPESEAAVDVVPVLALQGEEESATVSSDLVEPSDSEVLAAEREPVVAEAQANVEIEAGANEPISSVSVDMDPVAEGGAPFEPAQAGEAVLQEAAAVSTVEVEAKAEAGVEAEVGAVAVTGSGEVVEVGGVSVQSDLVQTGAPTTANVSDASDAADGIEQAPDSYDEVAVGSVLIPNALYRAFVSEARKFFESLETRVKDLVHGRTSRIDFETMRMSHSLAGMGRTTGLRAITGLAGAIENWAAMHQDRTVFLDETSKMTLLDALEALDAMIAGVEDKIEPVHEDTIIERLERLLDTDSISPQYVDNAEDVIAVAVMGPESADPDSIGNSVVRHDNVHEGEIIGNEQILRDMAVTPSNEPEIVQIASGDDEAISSTAGAGPTSVPVTVEPSSVGSSVIPPTILSEVSLPSAMVSVVPFSEQGEAGGNGGSGFVGRSEGMSDGINWLDMVNSKDDDVDAEMFEIFVEEAVVRFEEMDQALSGLAENPSDRKMTNSLRRAVHTMKGSANTAGARKVGALFHYLEDLMGELPVIEPSAIATVQSGVDAAFAAVSAMKEGRSVEAAISRSIDRQGVSSTPGTIAHAIRGSIVASGPTTSEPATAGRSSDRSETAAAVAVVGQKAGTAAKVTPAAQSETDENLIRVSAKLLDNMVKSVGEMSISRTRLNLNLDLAKSSMTGLAISLERMNGYLRAIELEAEKQMFAGTAGLGRDTEFDALQMDRFTRLQELTRRVAEAQNDVMTQHNGAMTSVRDMEEALAAQYVLVSDLGSDLDQVRQVRVSTVVPMLKRVVRQACRDTGKRGEIYFDADVQVDRGILDKVIGSLEHILRNAIAHGIEAPADRESLGKDAVGSIEFRAYQDGGEVVIEIRDDGRGMDSKRILAKAIERELVKPGVSLTDAEIFEFVFEPGFSTAEQVTDIAGRGVGLDVVRADISAMGGRIQMETRAGHGTTFVLRVPATLTVIAGTAITTNGHMYVVPVSFIDRLIRVNEKELSGAYKTRKLIVQDTNGQSVEYEFWGMWQVTGSSTMDNRPTSRNSVLLMRGDRLAVHVDDVRPASEFVFRPMGPQITAQTGLIGSTISAQGNASLVVDPSAVVRNMKAALGARSVTAAEPIRKLAPLVMIVDDSTTVRRVTQRLLKREGLRHTEAENGMQALERLQDETPDVILMDIEMPVMNGYEAVQAIRANDATRHIPIIMITSRVGEVHRQRALELGVNEYLGKPYNDSDLIDLIRKYTAQKIAANG